MEALLEGIEKEDKGHVALHFSTSWLENSATVEERIEVMNFPFSLLAQVLGLDKTATDYYKGKQPDNTMFLHTNAFVENASAHKGALKLLFAKEPVNEGLGFQVERLSRQEDIDTEFIITAVKTSGELCQEVTIKLSKNCFKKLFSVQNYNFVDIMFNRMRNEELGILTAKEIIEKMPGFMGIIKA